MPRSVAGRAIRPRQQLACSLVEPNSGGGFHFGGRFLPLKSNLPGELYPIHGSGFSSAWAVENASAERVELSLTSNGRGPFCYEARATYALDAGALSMWLSVDNLGPEPLPFGLGFHPWLVRTRGALLQAKAKWVVLENSDHLPDGEAPVASRVEWDFAAPRALPADWINNAFLGWDGRATIIWSDRELTLEVETDGPLSTYIVYSPSAKADFFCFEPVTHPVDAHVRTSSERGPSQRSSKAARLVSTSTIRASCKRLSAVGSFQV